MMLPITLTVAGAAALMNVWLGVRVSRMRWLHKVSIGHGGKAVLAARTRAHANFVEYTPFFLILLGLIEFARGPSQWLWGAGILFILGRLAHPFGMERPRAIALRVGGMIVTWAVLLALAGYAIALPYLARGQAPSISYATMAHPPVDRA